jgi:hypothetical protein
VAQIDSEALPQTYATPIAAPTPNRGLNDFFATIFAGPIMLARAFHPNQSAYYAAAPSNPPPAYAPQAYAAPNQTDSRNDAIDPRFLRQEVAYPARRRRARSSSIPRTSFSI